MAESFASQLPNNDHSYSSKYLPLLWKDEHFDSFNTISHFWGSGYDV